MAWSNFWPVKPDIVCEGGNFASPAGAPGDQIDDLQVLTTNPSHLIKPFSMSELFARIRAVEVLPVPREPSGVRPRSPGPVAAPANREELLERLRRRRRTG